MVALFYLGMAINNVFKFYQLFDLGEADSLFAGLLLKRLVQYAPKLFVDILIMNRQFFWKSPAVVRL